MLQDKEALHQQNFEALPGLQEFYEATTKHRKLSWIYSLGNCQLTGKFQTRTVDIIVQGLQASVLLLFNDGELLPGTTSAHACNHGLRSDPQPLLGMCTPGLMNHDSGCWELSDVWPGCSAPR